MQIIGLGWLALVIGLTCADVNELTTSTESSVEESTTGSVISTKLRKALLDALSNFDDDDELLTTTDSSEDSTTVTTPIITVHSFAAEVDTNEDNSGSNEIFRTIVIAKPRSTLQPPRDTETNRIDERSVKKDLDTEVEENINIENIQTPKSSEGKNKIEKPKKKATEKLEKPPKVVTTTVPAPVTNADGENIETSKDIQFQQAPLLSAFTVVQDEKGVAKQILPLLKIVNRQNNEISSSSFRPSQPIPSVPISSPPTTTRFTTTKAPSSSENLNNFNRAELEEKQRELEKQILVLQAKQREYEELIRRNQQFEQQRIRLEAEERQRQQQNQQVQIQQSKVQQLPVQQVQVQQNRPSQIQIIPSVTHSIGVSVEQQLPFKQPAEFHPENPNLQRNRFQNPFNQQSNRQSLQPIAGALVQQPTQQPLQPPFQQQNFGQIQQQNLQHIALPPQVQPTLQLPVRQFQGFQQFSNFQNIPPLSANLELPLKDFRQFNSAPQVSPLPTNLELPQRDFQTFNSAPLQVLPTITGPSITDSVPAGPSRNRVFRNDAGQTGNFGFNQPRHNFNSQQFQPSVFDSQIQNFLLQSGISPRSAEDFKIISKVLALNHGVPDAFLPNNGRF